MRCANCDFEVESGGTAKIGFRDSCDHCSADLHTCQNCMHHDPSAYNECVEPGAERVSQRDRANRCDWFAAGEGGGGEAFAKKGQTMSDLESLFKK